MIQEESQKRNVENKPRNCGREGGFSLIQRSELCDCGFRISDFGLKEKTDRQAGRVHFPIRNPQRCSAKHATQGEAGSQIRNRAIRNPQSQIRNAFTLIELLVVIAIISLLVSILLPSLKKAKELAQQVTCMSSLKAIGIGIGFYMEDSDAYYPLSNWTGGANPTWDGGYRCFVSQLWPYDIDPSSGIYNCPSADPIRDVTKADIDAAAAAGSGWRTYDYVGKYSMFYNTYLGYWSGTDWLGGAYEIKQADKIKAPICLMHCGDLRSPDGVGPLNSGGLSLYRPGMPSYDKWNQGQFQLPHGDEPNILWHDLSVTGPSENGDYGYYLENGSKDVIFHDEEGDYH